MWYKSILGSALLGLLPYFGVLLNIHLGDWLLPTFGILGLVSGFYFLFFSLVGWVLSVVIGVYFIIQTEAVAITDGDGALFFAGIVFYSAIFPVLALLGVLARTTLTHHSNRKGLHQSR